jgi:uncharacterized protein (TIGR02600 family)
MDQHNLPEPAPPVLAPAINPRTRPTGAALVIVLAFLVLLTGLIITFFIAVTGELSSSNSYAAGSEARMLGESAVQIVQSQINSATAARDSGNKPRLWASQPGMIRTWNSTGNADSLYKLYSSPSMVVPASGFTLTGERPPDAWKDFPEIYVDLNAPALVPDAKGTIAVNAQTFSARYPIMDPGMVSNNGANASGVEGFEITAAPGYSGPYPPLPDYNPATNPNPAAMPVQWIYVLADGTLTVPKDVNKDTINAFTVPPTPANPITGRIAFWADDETAKININTASEGNFWDIPRASWNDEYVMARNIPVQNEFQRTPGNPAGTSLSTVLGSLLSRTNAADLTDPKQTMSDTDDNTDTDLAGYKEIKAYWDLAPRINYTGTNGLDQSSRAGMYRTTSLRNTADPSPRGKPISLKAARLYSSVDEAFFSDAYDSATPKNRTQNAFGSATTSTVANTIAQNRFFLTVSGKADETTPFGTPKVAVWPIQSSASQRNAKDKLIIQAASLGGKAYYFQRKNGTVFDINGGNGTNSDGDDNQSSGSSTADYSFSSYANPDGSTGARNQQLYGYLQKLTGDNSNYSSIPGFGSNFASKWSALGRDRVLTESYDVTRSLINTEKFYKGVLPTADFPNVSYGFQWNDLNNRWKYGDSFVVPSEIDGGNGVTRGFGRFSTFSEFSFLFIRYQKDERAQPTDPPNIREKMQVILLLQPFSPTPGQAFMGNRVTITGLGGLALVGPSGSSVPLNFPSPATMRYSGMNHNSLGYSSTDTFRTFVGLLIYDEANKVLDEGGALNFSRALGTSDEDKQYPFYSNEIDVTDWNGNFAFTGTTGVKVEIKEITASAKILQTLNFDVPSTPSMALPDADGTLTTGNGTTSNSTVKGLPWAPRAIPGGFPDTNARFKPDSNKPDNIYPPNKYGIVFGPGDILRSVVFKGNPSSSDKHGGDLRVLALTKDVPATWFTKHPNYDAVSSASNKNFETGHFAYSLRALGDAFSPFHGGDPLMRNLSQSTVGNQAGANRWEYPSVSPKNDAKAGGLASGVQITQCGQPVTPVNLQKATIGGGALSGDWGSGYGFYQDGSVVAPIDCLSQAKSWGGYLAAGNNRPQDNGSLFEPTRMIPSPAAFGDLLTTNSSGDLIGWQTLLFNPVPAADTSHFGLNFSSNAHPGAKNPPDHLWMEFFWMPLVEPFALSESCSTLGKVNPNYQIAPFGYIQRSTGLQAALKTVRLAGIVDTDPKNSPPPAGGPAGNNYKKTTNEAGSDEGVPTGYGSTNFDVPSRFALNLSKTDGTLKIFNDFFSDGANALRTASEVCTLPLVPQGETAATLGTWWGKRTLTSDTLRESPYKQLYSRITTKSNTYTVHYRVQVLKQAPAQRQSGTWKENPNAIVGEYRGATTIERYLDPLSPGLPDYATDANARPLSDFYRFRTIANHQFIP